MIPKFAGEGRACCGVASVLRILPCGSEVEEGCRAHPFIYSGKEVVSISKWEALMKSEISRVRNLPNGKGWTKNERPKGEIWEQDPISVLPRFGPVLMRKMKEMGVSKVIDIMTMDDNDMQQISSKLKGLTMVSIKKTKDHAVSHAKPGCCQHQSVDYRKTVNLYESRYGSDWQGVIQECSSLSKYVCVKQLILHMDRESAKIMEGTKYEGKHLIYHDALTQMTDSRCVQWMREVGIYSRWIKPEIGCNAVITVEKDGVMKSSSRYSFRPIGNSPEMNPLDNSLFRDFRLNLSLNVAASWFLEKNDPKKFSLATPNDISKAFVRLWDPTHGTSPTSTRIMQDVHRIPKSLFKIAELNGKIVPGLANRNGHRKEKTEKTSKNFYKQNMTLEEMGIHHSLVDNLQSRYMAEKARFENVMQENVQLVDVSLDVIAP